MKIAQTMDGKQIVAAPTAPAKAVCPACGGTLILRSRRTMGNGKKTYYWRHRSNRNRNCSARNHPFN